jgi:hypothetical protein
MTAVRLSVALVALLWSASVPDARAQGTGRFLRPHALEVDLGGAWLGGVSFGTADAVLTRNQTPQAPYTLFSTSSRLEPALAAEGRVGFHLTSTFAIEGAFLFSRPSVETIVTGDVEGLPSVTASETLTQFLVDVSGVLHVRRLRFGRAIPFVLGGAGYLRELHEGEVLVESGHTYHLGGGAKIPLIRRRGFIRSLGVRLDGRVYFRSGGADLDEDAPARAFGAGGASAILEF